MKTRVYTAFAPFGGLGAGMRGILDARMTVLGIEGRFESVGGIDLDPAACEDFAYLTDSPSLCADIATLTVERLRAHAGRRAPDMVFLSPPCKGASGLLSQAKSETAKYRDMNKLALAWIRLMLAAWSDEPPRLVLLENVPRLKTRAASMLREVRSLLRAAGYVIKDGFHDCGELGGLAQHRRRYLLVARHQKRVPPLLYQPIKRRVRACGEVLGPLPMPGDPAAGPMHRLPKISWLNWVRLALIPAGGDWRDLPGVLDEGQPRREKFKRHRMEDWGGAVGTVGGSGSNGVENVADPRVAPQTGYAHSYRVTDWTAPAGSVTTSAHPSSGAVSVADPRWGGGRLGVLPFSAPAGTVSGESLPTNGPFSVADPRVAMGACKPGSHHNKYRVERWDGAAHTVIGATRPGSGAPAIADPRPGGWFNNVLGVVPWDEAFATVTGNGRPGAGAFSVCDPRVKNAYDHGYAVLDWREPSATVAGKSHPGNGAYSVADPRLNCEPRAGVYGVIPWTEAAKTVTGTARVDNGAFAIADPRFPGAPPLMVIRDVRKPPSGVPVILAADGTWHRPVTTLELAVLQGLPSIWKGAPLKFAGDSSSAWRERVGNAVPPPAAKAIGERMLVTLLQADLEAFVLDGSSAVWVEPEQAA